MKKLLLSASIFSLSLFSHAGEISLKGFSGKVPVIGDANIAEFEQAARNNYDLLQNRLNQGGEINLNPGVYYIYMPADGSDLEFKVHGTKLIGNNTTLVLMRESYTHSKGRVLSNGVDDILIKGIKFQGHKEEGSINYSQRVTSLRFQGGHNITIEDCEFSTFNTHLLVIAREESEQPLNWLEQNSYDYNSKTYVNILKNLAAYNVNVRRNTFKYTNPGNSHLAFAGVNVGYIYENNFPKQTDASGDTAWMTILVDDASAATPIQDYAVNSDIGVFKNMSEAGTIKLDGTASGYVTANIADVINVRTYDYTQQANNLPEYAKNKKVAFAWADHISQGIKVLGNEARIIDIYTSIPVEIKNNQYTQSPDSLNLNSEQPMCRFRTNTNSSEGITLDGMDETPRPDESIVDLYCGVF